MRHPRAEDHYAPLAGDSRTVRLLQTDIQRELENRAVDVVQPMVRVHALLDVHCCDVRRQLPESFHRNVDRRLVLLRRAKNSGDY
jgi:hypothetical protein